MPVRASLVINDRAATPVAHTYTPDGETPDRVHVFSEKTGVPASDPQFTASLKKTGGRYRPTLKLKVPITQTQTISGISNPVIVRYAEANVQFSFDALSTVQERKDCVGLMANALASNQAMINGLLVDLSDIYG